MGRHREATVYLQAKRVETPEAALVKSWRYPQVDTARVIEHKHSAGKGRPTPTSPIQSIVWQMYAQTRPDQERIASRKQQGACFVIGTNIDISQLSAPEVIQAYKAQAQAEGGFRLLKDPLFFVPSLFVKKPCRIQGLLMVMT